MTVVIECFGEPSVVFNGERTHLRGQQPLTLAALVAAGPDGTTTMRLYEELFGDNPPKSGHQVVVMRVQRLREVFRKILGDIPVLVTGSRIGIDGAHCTVDVWEFEKATRSYNPGWEAALSNWDEPYRGLAEVPQSVRVSEQRARNTYRAALAQVGWTIEKGDEHDLIARLQQELTGDLYNERLATSYAVALHRTGRQSEALTVLAEFRTRLLRHHGLNPSSDFDSAERSLLDNDIEPTPSPSRAASASTRPLLTEPDRFFGQVEFVEKLTEQLLGLDRTAAHGQTIQVIVGPGGSGKTTVLEKVLAPFDGDHLTIRIGSAQPDGGSSTEGSLYKPFVDALPEIASQLLDYQAPHAERKEGEPIEHLVHRTLQDAAVGEPTVLVLENMHDADSASVSLLRFLIGASQHPRLMVIVTTREPREGTAWHTAFQALATRPDRAAIHKIKPLSLSEIESIVDLDHPSQSLVIRSRFARRLESVSGGNPLVATVLSRDAPEDLTLDLLPGAIDPEEAYSQHVNSMIDDLQLEHILWVAAMIGLEFESNLIEEVLDLDSPTVEAELERFADLRLGRRRGLTRWEFDHLLTLNAIANRAGLMRPLLLARLAQAGTDNPLRLLRYIDGAGDQLNREFRVKKLESIASELEDQGALDEAAHAWTLLSELAPEDSSIRFDALVGAAGACSRIGRRHEASHHRAMAIEHARNQRDGAGVFRAALAGLPSGEYVGGEVDRLEHLQAMTPEERAEVSETDHAMWSIRFARLSDNTATAQALIESIDPEWVGDVEQRVGLELEHLCFEAQIHAVSRVHGGMHDLCEICPNGALRSDLLHRTALTALIEQHDAQAARDAVEQSAEYARTHGTPRTKWSSDVLAATLARVGLIDSPASPSSARTSGHRWGINDVEDSYMVQTFMDLWLSGQVGVAQQAIDAVHEQIAMNVAWHGALALGAAANGDTKRAQQEGARVVQTLDEQPDGVWAPVAASLLAEMAAITGDETAAERAIEALEPRSGLAIVIGIGSAHLGPVDRYLGLAATVIGDGRGSELLAAATEQAERAGITAWARVTPSPV